MPIKISEGDFRAAVRDYLGWCVDCSDFTRDMTEPDAEGYDCPDCGENTVMGAENALLMDVIYFDVEEGE